ncbi:hypothetical protein AQI88_28940 [Streptomyces cellostaticus]|uniref:Uncharacterized protein n=1 Tax=Streptomyces cellostaticus TaxID=67285 RepID=A0A117PV38_9ACTN|nr:hypothetical protein AQI88_28940 [Streptomyces cellostaticus]
MDVVMPAYADWPDLSVTTACSVVSSAHGSGTWASAPAQMEDCGGAPPRPPALAHRAHTHTSTHFGIDIDSAWTAGS